MRLKNKFFIKKIEKKLKFFQSSFFILHLDQNLDFLNLKLFFQNEGFSLLKIKNSLFSKYFKKIDPFFLVLKGSTFFLKVKNISFLFIFLEKYKNFIKKNNLYFLCFYDNFKLYSLKKVFNLLMNIKGFLRKDYNFIYYYYYIFMLVYFRIYKLLNLLNKNLFFFLKFKCQQ